MNVVMLNSGAFVYLNTMNNIYDIHIHIYIYIYIYIYIHIYIR